MRTTLKGTRIAKPIARRTTEIKKKKSSVQNLLTLYKRIIRRMKPKSKNEGGIQVTPIELVGNPGSGKSTFSFLSMIDIKEKYGDDCQLIMCKCESGYDPQGVLDTCVGKMEDKGVIWLVLDDIHNLAGKNNYEELLKFTSDLRHIYAAQMCKLRGITILPNTQAMDYIDTGIFGLMVIFQVKYKVNPQVRALFTIKLRFQHSEEEYYQNKEMGIFGSQAVLEGSDRSLEVLLGKYKDIGWASITLPGRKRGKIRYKLEKNDHRKLNEFFDVVVNLDLEYIGVKVKGKMAKSGKSSAVLNDKVPSGETWQGLSKVLFRRWFADKRIQKLYREGIFTKEGKRSFYFANQPKYHYKFIMKERILSWVLHNFFDLDKKEIAKRIMIRRMNFNRNHGENLQEEIVGRTIEGYYQKQSSFFKNPQVVGWFGDVIEEFVKCKLQAELDHCLSIIDTMDRDRKELIQYFAKSKFIVQKERVDVGLVNRKGDFQAVLSLKYGSAHSGRYLITPEDKIAVERGIPLVFLMIDHGKYEPLLRCAVWKPAEVKDGVDVYKPEKTFETFQEILFLVLFLTKQVLEEKKK